MLLVDAVGVQTGRSTRAVTQELVLVCASTKMLNLNQCDAIDAIASMESGLFVGRRWERKVSVC